MPKEVTKQKSTKLRKIITPVVAIVALVLLDLTPLGGGIRFYSKWVTCGQKPVVVQGSGFLNAKTPSYSEPPTLHFFSGARDYYCSPYDAERAGYSASENRRYYPNLEKTGELTDPQKERLERLQ